MKTDRMLMTAKAAAEELSNTPPAQFAERFIELRMWFFRVYGRGLISSTSHGIDYFQNIVDCIEGRLKWLEPGEPEHRSQYGDNFRKMVADRLT